ncbi:MAG: hypothetical protein HYR97_04875 [Candidatus Melainabacteria bacterium]|nr:hypothetical protein [Candidatus Melainabacteria bacterium]
MKIIPATIVTNGSSSTPIQGVVRVDVVKRDTFNYFLQKPKDKFTTDDKAIVIKLVQSLQSLQDFSSVAHKDVAGKIAEIEALATRKDIDLTNLAPYEAKAQKFAEDVIDAMKTWTLQVQREALHVAELGGTKFGVTLQDDEPHLAAIGSSPLDKEFSSSPDPLDLSLKEFNKPRKEIFRKTIGTKPISGHAGTDDIRKFLAALPLKPTKALEFFGLTGVEKTDFPFASAQHELGHTDDAFGRVLLAQALAQERNL